MLPTTKSSWKGVKSNRGQWLLGVGRMILLDRGMAQHHQQEKTQQTVYRTSVNKFRGGLRVTLMKEGILILFSNPFPLCLRNSRMMSGLRFHHEHQFILVWLLYSIYKEASCHIELNDEIFIRSGIYVALHKTLLFRLETDPVPDHQGGGDIIAGNREPTINGDLVPLKC